MLSFGSGAALVVLFAIVCQVLTERIKPLVPSFKGNDKVRGQVIQYITIIMGVVFAFAFKVDMFKALNVPEGYMVEIAYAFTGLAISGGTVFINDLFKLVAGAKDNKFAETQPKEEDKKPVVLNEEKPSNVEAR